MKYGWAGSGMVMIAIPILTSKAESDRAGESGVNGHKVLYKALKDESRRPCSNYFFCLYGR